MCPRRGAHDALVLLLLLAVLLVLPGLSLAALARVGQPLVATFIDVGQGDAIWIQVPSGEDILIDGGPQSATTADYLTSHGCTGIEYAILTHPHLDHYGGLSAVVESLPVERLWYGQEGSGPTYEQFWSLVNGQGIVTATQRAGQVHAIGAVTVTILHPTNLVSDANDNSIVCRVSYGSVDLMLTGDVQASGEDAMLGGGQPLEAEVLKVGHHGSETSSGAEFLQAVSPTVAIISVGEGNAYGHPSPAVLGRLAGLPAWVYRTDLQGTITVSSDGTSYSVHTNPLARNLYLPLLMRHAGMVALAGWPAAPWDWR